MGELGDAVGRDRNGIRRLYVAGLALHVCVLATAWAAHDLGYEVVLVADTTAAFTPGQRQVVLDDIAPHIGEVQSVQAVLATLGTPGRETAGA